MFWKETGFLPENSHTTAKTFYFSWCQALAIAAVYDPAVEVREACLDHLQGKRRPDVVNYFVGKLSPKKATNDINAAKEMASTYVMDRALLAGAKDVKVMVEAYQTAGNPDSGLIKHDSNWIQICARASGLTGEPAFPSMVAA